jgi:glutamate N-acetyltransferase/amino-acid N-acetyltransferase
MRRKFTVVPNGGVTSPRGFLAAGVSAGIKKARRRDVALIVSDRPATAAGTFTTNLVKAAPVQVSMRHIQHANTRAIIANSGNANACTGVTGLANARAMTEAAATALGFHTREVLVCSTGRIGRQLPMEVVRDGIARAVREMSPDGGDRAARAIMTSDSVDKQVAVRMRIDGRMVTIGACAKGAGMIDPLMATMLCFVTTDAAIDKPTLERCLREAVEQSFNCICVDGDMSTNDTVLCLANGAAGNAVLRSYHPKLDEFQLALNYVTRQLARKIVLDGEGVSRFVEVQVCGAAGKRDAMMAAESIARSMLVKCAWFGGDPNWGRVLAAVGYSGARVREELVDIHYDGLLAVKGGLAGPVPVAKLKRVVRKPSFRVSVNLHLGQGQHTVYTTDLTEEYVRFNKSE